MAKSTRNNNPSTRLSVSFPKPNSVCVMPSTRSRTVIPILMGISFLLLILVMAIGQISAVTPRIRRTLKIFEPMTLPMAMSAFPLIAPMKLTTSSGAEVPMPTMVSPITKSLMPRRLAIADEPSTSQSAPLTTRPRPMMNNTICSNISNYWLLFVLFSSVNFFSSSILAISSSLLRLNAHTFSTCIV